MNEPTGVAAPPLLPTSLYERQVTVDGVNIVLAQRGHGRPLLLLHSVDGIDAQSPFFDALSEHFTVYAPWLPGFGHSEWPSEFRKVSDLVLFTRQVIEHLQLDDLVLAGWGFGGWLAAELAVQSTQQLRALVLIDAFGIKVGGRDERDIADFYVHGHDELTKLAFHDPANAIHDYSGLPDDRLLGIARSREAFAYFGWNPYLHNPGLHRWLPRIDVPTQVLWGASDQIVRPAYGEAYAQRIPAAQFRLIERAGHYPHLEQPAAVAAHIVAFAEQLGS